MSCIHFLALKYPENDLENYSSVDNFRSKLIVSFSFVGNRYPEIYN